LVWHERGGRVGLIARNTDLDDLEHGSKRGGRPRGN